MEAPAFVERRVSGKCSALGARVSPGWKPRPSLSAERRADAFNHAGVSPGWKPRPSLSGPTKGQVSGRAACVAGVEAPAFVERCHKLFKMLPGSRRVAGVEAPAFVERTFPTYSVVLTATCRRGGSPGLR